MVIVICDVANGVCQAGKIGLNVANTFCDVANGVCNVANVGGDVANRYLGM